MYHNDNIRRMSKINNQYSDKRIMSRKKRPMEELIVRLPIHHPLDKDLG